MNSSHEESPVHLPSTRKKTFPIRPTFSFNLADRPPSFHLWIELSMYRCCASIYLFFYITFAPPLFLRFSGSRHFYQTFCKLSSKLLLRARVSTGRSTRRISVILYPSSLNLSPSLSVTRRGHRFHDESTVKKISPSPPRDLFESRNDPLRLFLLPHRFERFHRRRSANYDRLLHRSSPQ